MTDKKKAAALAAVTLFMMEEQQAEVSRPTLAPSPSPWPASGRDALMGMRQLLIMRLLKRV